MNRRQFIGAATGAMVGATYGVANQPAANIPHTPKSVQARGPFSIEIVSPQEEAVRELPLFDSYKQAQNFAIARMNLMRSGSEYSNTGEAGLIHVLTADNQVVMTAAWGETWSSITSRVSIDGYIDRA
jgi:hypothetical protein